jgi:hypothetical protein
MEIKKFIEEKDMSVRLKNSLIIASKYYTYMNELSVLKFSKIRNVGLKSTKELIEIYPELDNEVGFISVEQINYWLKK